MTFFSVCYCHLGEGKASGTGLMKDLFTYRRITMLQIREQKCLCLIILIVFWWQVSFISLSSCSVILPEDTFFESFTKLILCCFCFLFFWHIRGKSIFNNDTSTLIKYIINRRKYVSAMSQRCTRWCARKRRRTIPEASWVQLIYQHLSHSAHSHGNLITSNT